MKTPTPADAKGYLITTVTIGCVMFMIAAIILAPMAALRTENRDSPSTPTPSASPTTRPPKSVYTIDGIRAEFLTAGELGDKYKTRDLGRLKAPYWNPHAYDDLKKPRSVLICYGRYVNLSEKAHVARALYYRPFDGAGDNYVQRTYFVVAATYDDQATLETDYMKLRDANCPPTYNTPKTPIPSNLPRDRWWYHPPTRQTWQQFTQNYKGWTNTHALQSVEQPRWAGVWQQHQYTTFDYLTRGNAIIAISYRQATPNSDHRPITATSERLLARFINRLG